MRMNFCEEPEWLAFRLVDGRVAWETPTDGESLSSCIENPVREKAVLLHEVMDWLRDMLRDEDQPASDMKRQAGECGYSQATLRRACKKVKVRPVRCDYGPMGFWMWTLKPPPPQGEDEAGFAPAEMSPAGVRRQRRPKRSRSGPTRGPGRSKSRLRAILGESAADGAESNESPPKTGKAGKRGKSSRSGNHLSNGNGSSNGRPGKPR